MNTYIIYWNTGKEVLKYYRNFTYEELKQYIEDWKYRNPTDTLESVEEVFLNTVRIDIDGVV